MRILDRIKTARECARESSHLNAFALDLFDEAVEIAQTLDPSLPLYGLLYTVKDIFQLSDYPTNAGTKATLPKLGEEGPAVAALRAAGALCVGKVNTHEIALGLTGENQWTGDVKNPRDPARQSGGSSSGSAVSVATGACDFSIGSDTAGSIRVPASYCGVIGYKPTYGLVSLAGALPLVPSCDHVGILARDIDTVRAVLKAWGVPVNFSTEPRKPRHLVPSTWYRLDLNPLHLAPPPGTY
jgi:aspartyl-tRNA(Asn)/glutamyl-tRNA(Gln) amidotransferase subunit A